MKSFMSIESHLPTILVAQDVRKKIGLEAPTLNLFNIVYVSKSETRTILSWIQENQPALIILAVNNSESPHLNLIPQLKLDWLTRDIPIVLIGSDSVVKCLTNLDFNVCLKMPYSYKDLEQVICSLVDTPNCQIYA